MGRPRRQRACRMARIKPSIWSSIPAAAAERVAFDRETEVERTDLETVIADLMSGQFTDPIRVVAFNTLEH